MLGVRLFKLKGLLFYCWISGVICSDIQLQYNTVQYLGQLVECQCTVSGSTVLSWRVLREDGTQIGSDITYVSSVNQAPNSIGGVFTVRQSPSSIVSSISFTVQSSINGYTIICEDGITFDTRNFTIHIEALITDPFHTTPSLVSLATTSVSSSPVNNSGSNISGQQIISIAPSTVSSSLLHATEVSNVSSSRWGQQVISTVPSMLSSSLLHATVVSSVSSSNCGQQTISTFPSMLSSSLLHATMVSSVSSSNCGFFSSSVTTASGVTLAVAVPITAVVTAIITVIVTRLCSTSRRSQVARPCEYEVPVVLSEDMIVNEAYAQVRIPATSSHST